MTLSLCTFSIDDLHCGVPVERVIEVVGNHECTPVPLADPIVSGLINLRGQIVTALDLRPLLKTEDEEIKPIRNGETKKHIVISLGDERMSVLVDEIGPVMMAEHEMIESTPQNLKASDPGLIKAVARLPACVLLILDLDHLLTHHAEHNF